MTKDLDRDRSVISPGTRERENADLVPGKQANTNLIGDTSIGPFPKVPGKRSATEGLPDAQAPVDGEPGNPVARRWRELGADTPPRTAEDAASLAVDKKGAGQPVDTSIAAAVGAHTGTNVSEARVHKDPLSREATKAMGARAFAHGNDVFLGSGESETDPALMSHELTHVAQQRGALHQPQRKVEVGAANSPAERDADHVAGLVLSAAPPPQLLVDEGAQAVQGQMLKSAFMVQLKPLVIDTANAELGRLGSALVCPYIEEYFAKYNALPASATLSLITKWIPAAKNARTAADLETLVLGRVRGGVQIWKESGSLPPDIAAADPALAAQAQRAAPQGNHAQAKTLEGMEHELGAGEPVESKLAEPLGAGGARMHRGPVAARMAAERDAVAFAVGQNVVMGANAPSPGTAMGDALLAHELAHTAQQKDAASDPAARKKPIGAEDQPAERDADRAAGDALAQERLATLGNFASRVGNVMQTGVQLQRCANPPKTGLVETELKGAFEGKKVGESTSYVNGFRHTVPLKALRTLGAYDTDAAAIACVKTNGKPGAVTVETGKYVAYEVDLGFVYRGSSSANPMGGGRTQFYPPKLAPGVIALVSNEMMTVRAGEFDPAANADREGSANEALNSQDANPLQGYRSAFGDEKGDLNGLPNDKLIAAFNGALKDTALSVLNRSEEEVKTKQGQFAQGGAGISDTEYETMKQTAGDLEVADEKLRVAQGKLQRLQMSKAQTAPPAGGGRMSTMYDEEIAASQKEVETIQVQRKVTISKYPLLSRVDPGKFKSKSKDEMAGELGAELPGILRDIETTKQNVADGKVNLWAVDQIVDSTIAGFGLDENKRKVIETYKSEEATKKTIGSVVLAVFAIGFGIAATIATGGAALFFAAGAFGLGTYDAMKATDQYLIDKPASNVAEDKEGGFAEAPHWGWLVVAWVGVGLDAAQVASTVGKVARAEKTIAEGAKELAANARKLGMTEESLVAKLRQVAGDVDGATKIGEAHKAAVAGRLGVAVDIDPQLVGDVRVFYEVDSAGRVVVKGLAAGPDATIAEVLAHENVIKMMRRYEGATGKLRMLWDKLLAFAGKSPKGDNPFPKGSKAFESWFELQKHPELVEATMLKYKGGVRAANEGSLAKDLEVIEEEARRHQKIVDEMALEAGEGFIAKTGDSTRKAIAAGYPLPDGVKDAEELLAKGYYYRVSRTDPGKFEIVRKTQGAGPQLRVTFDAAGKPLKLVGAVERLESKIPDAAQLARLRAIVTDDARLAKLYDAAGDASRLEKLLKDVGDVGKLEALLKTVPNALDLEKLLKVFPIAELEPLVAGVNKPEQLALMIEHLGADNAGKMLRKWVRDGKFDKIDRFVENLAKGGKELAEKTAVGANSIIIDSNTAIALAKDADPALRGTMNPGEIARVAKIKALPVGTELRAGNVTVGEVGGKISLKGVPTDVLRDSPEYQKVIAKLEAANLGKSEGFADRALVADAFFAKTEIGVTAKFMTADQNIVKRLAELAGIDVNKAGGFRGLLATYGSSGFSVTVEGRTITVIPVP